MFFFNVSFFYFHREKLNLIFVGLKNGFIRTYRYGGEQIFESLDDYWTKGSHDNEYGAITHVITSFDDRFALSGGADGNLFGYIIKGDLNILEEQSDVPKMPAYRVNEISSIEYKSM